MASSVSTALGFRSRAWASAPSRAAQRFRGSYYLYVVTDPLGERPALSIIRDPWARLSPDNILYSGARYVYNARTWRAAADTEIPL